MLKRTLCLSLAMLVLLSSAGYGITAHLCGGKPVSYSLFGRPADCGMGEEPGEDRHCEHPGAPVQGKNLQAQKCCSDQTFVVQGLQHLADFAKKSLELPTANCPPAATFPTFERTLFASQVKPRFADYRPPDRANDLPVLLQVFRI